MAHTPHPGKPNDWASSPSVRFPTNRDGGRSSNPPTHKPLFRPQGAEPAVQTLEVVDAYGAGALGVRYNPATEEFGVAQGNGTIRTYFKPDPSIHGYATNLDYFNAQ